MGMTASWEIPPPELALPQGTAHIWRADLGLPGRSIQGLEEKLSMDERIKAERFRLEKDRIQFITARGILRFLLGCYLNVEPEAIRFAYEKNGKPRVAYPTGKGAISFSLSHSHGIALYGFCWDQPIGVDVESIREFPEMSGVARDCYTPNENNVFEGLSEREKVDAFFTFWTLKEAFIKAIGDGLSYPLQAFDVSAVPGKPGALLTIPGEATGTAGWFLKDLKVGPGFAAAFAIKGGERRIHYWQWSPWWISRSERAQWNQ